MKRIREVKKLVPFVNDRIRLRLLSMEDIDWYANAIYSDNYNRFMDNKVNKLDFAKVKMLLSNLALSYSIGCKVSGECRLIIEDVNTNEKIGGISLFEIEKDSIALGYWILPAYQNKGYAQCSINLIKDLVFSLSKIESIILEIQSANISSMMVAYKTGFNHIDTSQGKVMENMKFELRKSQYVKR